MKHLIPISTLLLVFCGPALSQEPEWKEFASKEGGFKALMLGAPRAEEQKVRSPAGPLVNRLFVTQTAKEEVVYLVSYAEYPEEAFKQYSPEQILEAARTGTVENLKGKLASDSTPPRLAAGTMTLTLRRNALAFSSEPRSRVSMPPKPPERTALAVAWSGWLGRPG